MPKNLDLLLVNAGGSRKRAYQSLSQDYSAIEPPFWAALTAGFIRRNGYRVGILDANAENIDFQETAEKIKTLNPRFVGIVVYGQHPSASTQTMDAVGKLCRTIKLRDPKRKIILSGLHPSALPEKTLKEEQCDYVACGEGFYTFLDLLLEKEPAETRGLAFRKNGEVLFGAKAEIVRNLTEELNDVAWDLLPMDKYKAHNWHCLHNLNSRNSYAAIYTSLGCPFSCSFCCINTPFGKQGYRTWSPEWVLKNIDTLVREYGIKNIKIIDELFVLKPEHFMPICKGLIERDYGLNFWAYARIDTAKEEYLEKMKQAGINWLAVGIESGSEEVRKDVSKGRFNSDEIKTVVERIRREGINVIGNYIFGLPEDNLKNMAETLNLAQELNCEWANFYSAMAYPGSRLYFEAKEQGLLLPEDTGNGWAGYSQTSYETLPLPTKYISAEQVLRFRDEAFMKYFTNPEYLNMIEKKFGLEARKHIEEMTKIKLKRKL